MALQLRHGQYTVMVTNLLTGDIISTIEINDMHWEKIYKGPGSFYGTVRFDAPTSNAANLKDFSNGIWVVKDGEIKFGGILGRVQRRGETRSISVPAIGFFDYLNQRILKSAQGMTHGGALVRSTDIEWNNIDPFYIFQDCVDHAQSFTDGDLHLGVTWDALSGYSVRLVYPTFAAKRIGPLLLQLANRADTGFDFKPVYKWVNGQPRCDFHLTAPALNDVSSQMLLFQLDHGQLDTASSVHAVQLPGTTAGRLTAVTTYTDDTLVKLTNTYTDPSTSNTVYRLTTDGAASSLSNFLGDSSGYNPWSRTSTKFLYTKYSPTNVGGVNGIYVYDIANGGSYPVTTTDSPFSFPIFDWDEEKVYFLKGYNGTTTGAGSKPIKLCWAWMPTNPDYGGLPIDRSNVALDITAEAEARSLVVSDVVCLCKNAAYSPTDNRFFGLQVKVAGGWMTVLPFPNSSDNGATAGLYFGWDFNSANGNTWHTSSDNTMVWSNSNSRLLYATRPTSGSNHTPIRAVFDFDSFTPQYSVTTTSGTVQINGGDTLFHKGTNTTLHVSPNCNPFTWDGTTGTNYNTKGALFAALHINLDRASTSVDIEDIRVAAAEYDTTSGALPYLYLFPIGDFNVGTSDSDITAWSTIRTNRKLAGHRHTMSLTGLLARFSPQPFISPNGKYVLWNSNSQTTIDSQSYPGSAGGNNGTTTVYTDLYLVQAKQSLSTIRNVKLVLQSTEPDWTPSATKTLYSEWGSAGSKRFRIQLLTTGKLRFEWSTDGTNSAGTVDSTSAVGFTDNTLGTIKVSFDVNNGASNFAAHFWKSTDGGITWTAI